MLKSLAQSGAHFSNAHSIHIRFLHCGKKSTPLLQKSFPAENSDFSFIHVSSVIMKYFEKYFMSLLKTEGIVKLKRYLLLILVQFLILFSHICYWIS